MKSKKKNKFTWKENESALHEARVFESSTRSAVQLDTINIISNVPPDWILHTQSVYIHFADHDVQKTLKSFSSVEI